MSDKALHTFKQFSQKHPAFPESSLRWLRFNSKTNGLASAFKKVGRRILIDENEFFECIEQINRDK